MALSDYIPQIFGSAPQGYQGLLGEEQTAALQKQANLQGLLSSAVALAQGMSAQGPRRSAAQNILGALASGFGTTGQAYQQGLQNYSMQQQLALQQQQKAGAEKLKLQYPDLAQMIDTNLPGAMRIIADIEQEKRQPKLTAVKPDEVLVGPGGNVVYTAPKSAEKTASVLTAQEATALGLPSGVVYQRTADGKIAPIEGTGAKAPEIKDFADGTTRQYDNVTKEWKVIARKPAGEAKQMYERSTDANGNIVWLPKSPNMPVLDASGKPIGDYKAPVAVKPLPAGMQKAEEEDFDGGQASINLAQDANKYLNLINNGTIKFGRFTKAYLNTASALGSDDPDVVARNDFERFKTNLVNESLRLNKGTQTDNDAERAAKELLSAESPVDAAKVMIRIRDLNARRAKDYQSAIDRRRKNAKLGEVDVKLDIPAYEPQVFNDAEYYALPKGTTYIDPKGVRRVKP